jgi:hypothetical protein
MAGHPNLQLRGPLPTKEADQARRAEAERDTSRPATHLRYLVDGSWRGSARRPDAFDRGDLHLLGETGCAEAAFRSTTRRMSGKHASWVVHVEAPEGRPVEHVVGYLARYVKRVAIADARILAITDATVTIATRQGPRVLHGVEFVRRFLNHVPPRSFRKVRYYGLYAPGNAKHRLEVARELLAQAEADGEPEQVHADEADLQPDDQALDHSAKASWRCPACSSHRTYRVFFMARGVARIARAPP